LHSAFAGPVIVKTAVTGLAAVSTAKTAARASFEETRVSIVVS
jgi:hypothetical protein